MFEKEKAKDNAIMKWSPIIKDMGFKSEDIAKVCYYADNHAFIESQSPLITPGTDQFIPKDETTTLLPISLKVLLKVKDLSKVHFELGPMFKLWRKPEDPFHSNQICTETVKTYSNSCNITVEQIMAVSAQTGVNVVTMIEQKLVEKLAEEYNKLIEEGNELYIFIVAQSVGFISEGTLSPEMRLLSRYHIERTGQNEKTVSIDDM